MGPVRRVVGGFLLLLVSCEGGVPPQGGGQTALRLDGLSSWGGQGRFLVSPRPAGDGRSILASGPGGFGALRIDLVDGRVVDAALAERAPAVGADGFSALAGAEGLGLRHEAYSGRLTLALPDGERVLAEHGAWGVTVAPGGQGIAYCAGPLSAAWLTVLDAAGRTLFSGPGAQPAWSVDGRLLIYSLPQAAAEPARGLSGAELVLLENGTGRSWALTATPDRTEMQPAFTPDGQVVYADWQSGTVHLARLVGPEVGP